VQLLPVAQQQQQCQLLLLLPLLQMPAQRPACQGRAHAYRRLRLYPHQQHRRQHRQRRR
jgi:hypothetical protein